MTIQFMLTLHAVIQSDRLDRELIPGFGHQTKVWRS